MRKAFGVGRGILKLIVANQEQFPVEMFANREDLDSFEGANLFHALDEHNSQSPDKIELEDCTDDRIFSFADKIVEVLKKVESVAEMKDLLKTMNVKDYVDYVRMLFPSVPQKKRDPATYFYGFNKVTQESTRAKWCMKESVEQDYDPKALERLHDAYDLELERRYGPAYAFERARNKVLDDFGYEWWEIPESAYDYEEATGKAIDEE